MSACDARTLFWLRIDSSRVDRLSAARKTPGRTKGINTRYTSKQKEELQIKNTCKPTLDVSPKEKVQEDKIHVQS